MSLKPLNVINAIEESLDFKELDNETVQLWPLYRFYILDRLRLEELGGDTNKRVNKFKLNSLPVYLLQLWRVFSALVLMLKNRPEKKVMFLSKYKL